MVYLISTVLYASLSSRGLGHQVFILVTGVRIPVGMPFFVLNLSISLLGSPCHPTWYKSPWGCHFLMANEDASLHFTRQQPLFTQKAQPFLHIFTSSVSCRGRPIRNSRHINKAHNGCSTHTAAVFFFIFLTPALDFFFFRCMVSSQEAGHIPSEQRLHQSHQTLQYVVIKLERLCSPASVLF